MSVRSFGIAVMAAVVACWSEGPAAATGRLVEITGSDQMKFNVMTITAKPGELLHVRLKSVGTLPKIAMAHNFVLLANGTDAAVFANASATASATAYIPAQLKAKVLASTALVGPGETVDVTFKAPSARGQYTLPVQFPGPFHSRHERRARRQVRGRREASTVRRDRRQGTLEPIEAQEEWQSR